MEGDFVTKKCCGAAFGHNASCVNWRPKGTVYQATTKDLAEAITDKINTLTAELAAACDERDRAVRERNDLGKAVMRANACLSASSGTDELAAATVILNEAEAAYLAALKDAADRGEGDR